MDQRDSGTSPGGLGRWLAASFALAAAIGLLGIGIAFSSSFGAAQVAEHATALHWTNAALGSSGIARASVAQAIFFAFDERLGVSSSDAKDAATHEASANLDGVEATLMGPDRTADSELIDHLTDFVVLGRAVVDEADQGNPDRAEQRRLEEFEPAFAEIEASLQEEQSALASSIADSQAAGGRIARLTQVAITFLIPGATMLIFWWLMRRRMVIREVALNARLEAERRLSIAKDEFIAGLSHELRTPLTTIHGFSDVLLDEPGLGGEVEEMLRIINQSSSELTRMVNDLITAARIDDGSLTWRPEQVGLTGPVEAALAPYRRTGKTIDVQLPTLDVYADPGHVRQIVHNLVSNAIRHGGDKIIVSARDAGSKAMLIVADNGPGITEGVGNVLFERFVHRGRRALIAGSVGLGLAVSRELAMRMGGHLSYNRIGDWTTFTLTLPHLGDLQRAPIDDKELVAT